MCAYSVFNTFPVYPLSAKPLILLAFCRYRYHTSLFNRPGFQAMLAEAEAWKIGTIIVKDMSRFCRNYLEVGFYTEILFPKKQIRFIAINNSVRAMLRIEPKPRRNAGRRMTVISTRSVSANSAAKRFIRTAQGRGFATPTVQNSISRQKHCFLGW